MPKNRQTFRTRIMHWFFLMKRPMTLGVRLIVVDEASRVLLVKHTYVPGWHLPGGGVETGETLLQCCRKELFEETGLELTADPVLLAVLANRRASRRDHVALYLCRDWREAMPFRPNREIAEIGFFATDRLPDDTTAATRARITETFESRAFPEKW